MATDAWQTTAADLKVQLCALQCPKCVRVALYIHNLCVSLYIYKLVCVETVAVAGYSSSIHIYAFKCKQTYMCVCMYVYICMLGSECLMTADRKVEARALQARQCVRMALYIYKFWCIILCNPYVYGCV